MTAGRTPYTQALAAFDPASILATLSDDVTIRVAVHDEPMRGKETAGFLFGILTQELTPFELVDEIVEGDKSVVLFETSLRGERAYGLNVVALESAVIWPERPSHSPSASLAQAADPFPHW